MSFASPAFAQDSEKLRLEDVQLTSNYPWKKRILTTFFWIGQGSTSYSSTTNYKSAWDQAWTRSFGGVDSPKSRKQVDNCTTTLPEKFAPTLNPFYVALPFNDVKYPKIASKVIPWWDEKFAKKNRWKSQCKGRWVMIERNGKVCFAQWEDVGPLEYNAWRYVFKNARPTRAHSGAGLDISIAVRDYLGIKGNALTNWRFVEASEVPYGPWLKYAEQAILFQAIKAETASGIQKHSGKPLAKK